MKRRKKKDDQDDGKKASVRSLCLTARPDKRLPRSRAGGQGPYLRSLEHLGINSGANDRKENNKVHGPTNQLTDVQSEMWLCSTQLKMSISHDSGYTTAAVMKRALRQEP